MSCALFINSGHLGTRWCAVGDPRLGWAWSLREPGPVLEPGGSVPPSHSSSVPPSLWPILYITSLDSRMNLWDDLSSCHCPYRAEPSLRVAGQPVNGPPLDQYLLPPSREATSALLPVCSVLRVTLGLVSTC